MTSYVDDNIFPKLVLVEGTTPASPSSGDQKLFLDSGDHKLKRVNSSGTVTTIEGGGGGGGLTHTYYGYNTVGASFDTMVNRRVYCKQFTLAAAGTVTGIDAHLQGLVDDLSILSAYIFEDNSGVPRNLLAGGAGSATNIDLVGSGGTFRARWFSLGLTCYLASGTYWMAVQWVQSGASSSMSLAYDTGGSDRYWTQGGNVVTDGDYVAQTNSTRDYSLRLSVAT